MTTEIEAVGQVVLVSPLILPASRSSGCTRVTPRLVGLDALRAPRAGWDGVNAIPPNDAALDQAQRALLILYRNWMVPEDTLADVDGGIAFWFYSPEDEGPVHQAAVQCMNSGEMLMYLEERPEGDIKVYRVVELGDDEIATLRDFVRRQR